MNRPLLEVLLFTCVCLGCADESKPPSQLLSRNEKAFHELAKLHNRGITEENVEQVIEYLDDSYRNIQGTGSRHNAYGLAREIIEDNLNLAMPHLINALRNEKKRGGAGIILLQIDDARVVKRVIDVMIEENMTFWKIIVAEQISWEKRPVQWGEMKDWYLKNRDRLKPYHQGGWRFRIE